MLRLVAATELPARAELRRVAIWHLDGELAAYVERRMHLRWPQLSVERVAADAQLALIDADLWICGSAPTPTMSAPVLWLGEVDRGAGVIRLNERLWKSTMPMTGRQLERAVDAVWQQARPERAKHG